MSDTKLIEKLNGGLGWELRAAALYSHYSAYVKGIHRIHLKAFFDEEASESNTHADMVRAAIVKLGGQAVTDRDPTEIVHTTDYKVMLEESLKTEQKAAKGYEAVLALIKDDEANINSNDDNEKDELYTKALEIIKIEKKASTSLLQRKLQIGYNRAARIMEMMEKNGIVGQANHVGKREIL